MDFTTAEHERERLSSQRARPARSPMRHIPLQSTPCGSRMPQGTGGSPIRQDPLAGLERFCMGPGPSPGKEGLQPGTAKTFVEFKSRR